MSNAVTPFRISSGDTELQGVLHNPANPPRVGLVLTHGAGANCESPLLVALANAFCDAGIAVLRFNLPFRMKRPHGPPPPGSAERDQAGLRDAVNALRAEIGGDVYMGGHSYGGRQATLLAASDPDLASGLLLLSYPLHPPKRPEQMRTAHFGNLRTPALFVSGTRDGFGTVEEMQDALKLIPAQTKLVTIEGAGHELMSKKNAAELPGRVVEEWSEIFVKD
jgi:uncharacterized protein